MPGPDPPASVSTLAYCLQMLEELSKLLMLPDGDLALALRVKALLEPDQASGEDRREKYDA